MERPWKGVSLCGYKYEAKLITYRQQVQVFFLRSSRRCSQEVSRKTRAGINNANLFQGVLQGPSKQCHLSSQEVRVQLANSHAKQDQ